MKGGIRMAEESVYQRREVPNPNNPNETVIQYVDQHGVLGDAFVNQLAKPKPKGKPRMANVVKVNDPFVRFYRNNVQQVIRDRTLTTYEFGILMQLSAFIGWGTLFVTDDEGQRLSMSETATLLGVSKGYLHTILKSLEAKGFVHIYKPDNNRSNFIMVNGSISFFGKWLNDEGEEPAFDESPYEPVTRIVHPNKRRRASIMNRWGE
jgi:DNA-binding MarR family transcriptional regulator